MNFTKNRLKKLAGLLMEASYPEAKLGVLKHNKVYNDIFRQMKQFIKYHSEDLYDVLLEDMENKLDKNDWEYSADDWKDPEEFLFGDDESAGNMFSEFLENDYLRHIFKGENINNGREKENHHAAVVAAIEGIGPWLSKAISSTFAEAKYKVKDLVDYEKDRMGYNGVTW